IPAMASPMAVPMMPDSSRGVSTTRSLPCLAWSPSVTRKTPPLRPTSSPRRMTSGSDASAWSSAWLMAPTRVCCGMGVAPLSDDGDGGRGLGLLLSLFLGGEDGVDVGGECGGDDLRDGLGGLVDG